MQCVILQPSYIPWRGYFDLIHRADLFVFYDDVQYDTRGWRHRNKVKTPSGSKWLTIPVHSKGAQTHARPLNSIEVAADREWRTEHYRTLERLYSAAPFFADHRPWLQTVYRRSPGLLTDFTIPIIMEIAELLGITTTRFMRSSEVPAAGKKTDRLLSILEHVGATRYLSGPSARDYIESEKFDNAGIALEWMTYDYPEYPQLYPPFDPAVTVLDLLFMTGSNAASFIWGPRQAADA